MVKVARNFAKERVAALDRKLKKAGATMTVHLPGSLKGSVTIGAKETAAAAPPAAVQQSFGFDNTHGFLGEEFLLWLWWKTEEGVAEWTILSPWGEKSVGIAMDDLLAFAPNHDDETRQTLRDGTPTCTPEARAALRQGHRIAKAKLTIAVDSHQFTATIDGATLALSGVRLGDDAEDCESAEDRTVDRAESWAVLTHAVEQLFSRFCNVRTTDNWQKEAAAIARWMGR